MKLGNHRNPGVNNEMIKVCQRVVNDAKWRPILDETTRIILDYDPGIFEEIDFQRHQSKTLQSMVRYCIPIFEIHQALDGRELPPSSLASIFLWQEVWRPLDNLLDCDGEITTNLREYNYRILRAWNFHRKVFPNSNLMERFLACLNSTLQIEEEHAARADASRIFQRVSIYEVPFNEIDSLSNASIECYRNYINAIGIAHDFGDVVKDSSAKKCTFATETLRQIDPYLRINASSFASLREEGVSAFCLFSKKLDDFDLERCWVTRENMNAFYNWAFKS